MKSLEPMHGGASEPAVTTAKALALLVQRTLDL